ncbi:MAG: VF530 family protein [Xanthomonadales bacterium]|nr:VF530 family protein [Xanthomonadales bacterium]
MNTSNSNDPLHGITLVQIITKLVDIYGWAGLGERIDIRCFNNDPSIKSSLKFLRKTPWARQKVEDLFVASPRLVVKDCHGPGISAGVDTVDDLARVNMILTNNNLNKTN